MSEKYEIFSAAFSANSLRATGFKSTHYALAELIDNSVQSAIEDKKNKNCPHLCHNLKYHLQLF